MLKNLITTLVTSMLAIGVILVAILVICWHAWVGITIWNMLAIPIGLPALSFKAMLAIIILYSTILAPGTSELFPKETDAEKKRYHSYILSEIVLKPIMGLVLAWIIKIWLY